MSVERYQRVRAAIELGKQLTASWSRTQAEQFYDDVETLADLSALEGDGDLSEALLGLSAYISSFVDSATPPKEAQLKQLGALLDGAAESIERAAGGVQIANLGRDTAASKSVAEVAFLGGADLAASISMALAEVDLSVSSLPTAESLMAAIRNGTVLTAVIEANQLEHWRETLEQNMAVLGQTRPPTVVVSHTDHLTARLAATRCNADAFFVIPAEMRRVAARVQELISDRAKPYRVLIVDDDASMTLFCDSILRHNGMETRAINDPEQALAVLTDFSPEVILADLYMPEINGLDLIALFRSHPKTMFTPVILLSGDDDAEKRFDALIVGGDDYLTKPIRPRHLVAAVSSRARRARYLRRELAAVVAQNG
jgi:DNA-binding response OmpR family regulator